jgi:hypothetical protein
MKDRTTGTEKGTIVKKFVTGMKKRVTLSKKRAREVSEEPVENSSAVYIRVRLADLDQASVENHLLAGQQSSGHLYLIEGTFSDIARYAGLTAEWIIRVARLLCEPLGSGRIFTHTTGTTDDWYSPDRTTSWREVVHGDVLLPGIYEFEPVHRIVLSKICERQNRSVTTTGTTPNATTFREQLERRDSRCVVSRSQVPIVASHLIPRRLGPGGVTDVVERFTGVTEVTDVDLFDPRIGITLFEAVDHWVDRFQAGFYHITVNHQMQLFIVFLNIAWHRVILIPSTISTPTILG